ncbi:small vasohibin-binding protein isoform X1 [Nerophis ophidion]|uniref:small vasohibin-binding protein isoform X1 n=1 Tax=Nerophis ophidion TaxID=159077 RepID=UPI002ADF329F|nr:small vasohibin-binding protein isoform X1 [Nerophis ophidion]
MTGQKVTVYTKCQLHCFWILDKYSQPLPGSLKVRPSASSSRWERKVMLVMLVLSTPRCKWTRRNRNRSVPHHRRLGQGEHGQKEEQTQQSNQESRLHPRPSNNSRPVSSPHKWARICPRRQRCVRYLLI